MHDFRKFSLMRVRTPELRRCKGVQLLLMLTWWPGGLPTRRLGVKSSKSIEKDSQGKKISPLIVELFNLSLFFFV
jgi:hypothetical protein